MNVLARVLLSLGKSLFLVGASSCVPWCLFFSLNVFVYKLWLYGFILLTASLVSSADKDSKFMYFNNPMWPGN